ncbi:MAG: hypothetical protein V2A69_07990, partial [Pseudomonadota bacterium]
MGFNWKISLLPETTAICRLPKEACIPPWALTGYFFSVTRTAEELSVVCPQINVPEGIKKEEGWRGLKVEGPLDFQQPESLLPVLMAGDMRMMRLWPWRWCKKPVSLWCRGQAFTIDRRM